MKTFTIILALVLGLTICALVGLDLVPGWALLFAGFMIGKAVAGMVE